MQSSARIAVLGGTLIAHMLVGTAQVPQAYLGTWKLNVAKSKYSPGPTRVTHAADGKTRTLVTTGTNADGTPVTNTTVWERQ